MTTMIDRSISKEICDAITERLVKEGFQGNEVLAGFWEVLEQMKQIILIGRKDYVLQNWHSLTVVKNIALDFVEKAEPQEGFPNGELVLREAQETRERHSHGSFSSLGYDGLD